MKITKRTTTTVEITLDESEVNEAIGDYLASVLPGVDYETALAIKVYMANGTPWARATFGTGSRVVEEIIG